MKTDSNNLSRVPIQGHELLQRHNKLTAELKDTTEFGEALKIEVSNMTRKTSFKEEIALRALGFKRIQLGMVPNKLISLEEDIAALEAEITKYVDSVLTPAVGRMERAEVEQVKKDCFTTFRPGCKTDAEANTMVDNSELVREAYAKYSN